MAVKKLLEMPKRGPQKKLPKYKANEIAKDVIQNNISSLFYSITEGMNNPADKYNLSQDDIELVDKCMDQLLTKMFKSIGREWQGA